MQEIAQQRVALRKESVDRNLKVTALSETIPVALRKESVDRNTLFSLLRDFLHRRSP